MFCSPVGTTVYRLWLTGPRNLIRKKFFISWQNTASAMLSCHPPRLKMMRQVNRSKKPHDYSMRSIGSGGESLGAELLDWGREVMGLTINEFYGQTEVNLVVGSCSEVMEIRPGSMGRAIPGHVVEVVDESRQSGPLRTGGRGRHQDPRSCHVSGILEKS